MDRANSGFDLDGILGADKHPVRARRYMDTGHRGCDHAGLFPLSCDGFLERLVVRETWWTLPMGLEPIEKDPIFLASRADKCEISVDMLSGFHPHLEFVIGPYCVGKHLAMCDLSLGVEVNSIYGEWEQASGNRHGIRDFVLGQIVVH